MSFLGEDTLPTLLNKIKSTFQFINDENLDTSDKTIVGAINELEDKKLDLENYYALQRTRKVYTVRWPKWETSQISTCEKLDDNAGLVHENSTNTTIGKSDYDNIPLFRTIDVNAYVDENGVRHVTAIKGDQNFKDTGKVDVFVMGMSYYEKFWSDDEYFYYSITDLPKEGYTIAQECKNRDGSIQPFALYAKYVGGEIDGIMYSSKGLIPKYKAPSYNWNIENFSKKGSFYTGALLCEYKMINLFYMLMTGKRNSQDGINGCWNYNFQYQVSQTEEDTNRVILTKAQANNFVIDGPVTLGDPGENTNLDRYYDYMRNIVEYATITKIEDIDDTYSAVYLDCEPFTTTEKTYISSWYYKSGFSDKCLGRCGCPGDFSGKYPMVWRGIELAVGGYEVPGNAFMDIVDETGRREAYVTNDATKLTTNITTAKANYKKSQLSIQPTTLGNWNYITEMQVDIENGAFLPTQAGQSGSGSATGFCDGLYVDTATTGQREFLVFGGLGLGVLSGLSYLHAYRGVAHSDWSILARPSINAVIDE